MRMRIQELELTARAHGIPTPSLNPETIKLAEAADQALGIYVCDNCVHVHVIVTTCHMQMYMYMYMYYGVYNVCMYQLHVNIPVCIYIMYHQSKTPGQFCLLYGSLSRPLGAM